MHCKEFKPLIPPREYHLLVSSVLDLPASRGEGRTPHPLSLLSRALSEAEKHFCQVKQIIPVSTYG